MQRSDNKRIEVLYVKDLEQLSSEERKVAMIVDEATFSSKIQQEIDCVGCVSSLHTYLYELSELAKNKPGSVLYFEGFVVYGDRRIGFSEEKVGDIHNIAYILHHHKSKNSVIDELTRSLNIKKKHDGHLHRGKVLSRCLLHSKKPMPSENDINEVASVAELDESVFLSSLQMHTKKRKFCSTCRDNIMFVYDNMLEEASNCSDCEEECDEEEEEEEEEEGEEEYEETEEGPLEAPKPHQKLHGNEIASVPNTNSTTAATSDYEYINERADNLDGRDTDQGRVISYARKSPGSLLACIKYCPERRKIAIPLEMEIFMEFLSKAESGSTTHTKHANTKEAAQEELVACIGSCLKERLQNIWRSKKSEELARILFMKLVADCVVDGIRQKLEEKNFRLGHKTILEEYLNETEAAEQQKKEKQRQKRQKRKEKKKILKQSETDNPGDTENNGDEERETGEENDGNVTDKDVGELNKIENKDQINYKKQEKKKKKKAKNKESSATYDKISTDSNTPETKKSIEKKDQVTGVKKSKKEIEEEEKLETKKSNEELGNIRNNRFMNNEERERRLLIAMGWNEELSENEAGVDEKEVKKLRDKWKEIEASRADFRKNAKEKFMRLLNSK